MATSYWQSDVSSGLKRAMTDELAAVEKWRAENPDLYPGLGSEMRYIEQRAVWRDPSCCSARLVDALRASKLLHPTLNLDGSSWEDVLGYMRNYVDNARSTYEAKVDNSKIRRWARDGESTASIGKRLAEVIPDEKGLRALRVGLSYMFQAWAKRLQNKTAILDTLEDIPALLVGSTKEIHLYQDDELSEQLCQLYLTVMDALPSLVDVLNRAYQDKSVFQKLVKQEPEIESQVIDSAIVRIRQAKNRYFDRVVHLHRASTKETERRTNATQRSVGMLHSSLSRHSNETRNGHATIVEQARVHHEEVQQKIQDLEQVVNRRFEQYQQALERIAACRQGTDAEILMGHLHQFFAEHSLKRTSNAIDEPSRSATPDPTTSRFANGRGSPQAPRFIHSQNVTADSLLDILNAPDTLADAERIVRQANSIIPRSLDRARWLMVTPQFKDWFGSAPSSLLLVDGYSKDQGRGKTSPVSILCTSFATMLVETRAGIVLQFYCGHSNLPDHLAGPKALLRSITSQLVLFPKGFDLAFDSLHPGAIKNMQNNDINSLCYCFEHLLRQIPLSTSVYVIIDGVSSFESSPLDFDDDLDFVFYKFRQLVDTTGFNGNSGPRLKVLMTSAHRSVRLAMRQDVDRSREYVSLNSGNAVVRPLPSSRPGSMRPFR
ncbi:hypothetical protein GJ744_006881 [Endocarpon pusillum]|uniref:Nephrocystin 3-like N-terminal domain-containing protein n=1 Tax=Endocarpon pusillum TaxID=364733 RepID=A0A8H7A7X4_9EURO|nr:hypothetical protein GJ744_006881 [Endocarpon pusillum]